MPDHSAAEKKLLDNLQNDLRNVSTEAKKKHPPLKEAAESGIVKIRSAATRHADFRLALLAESAEIMEPFFMGCDTKSSKMVQICLTAIQRLITFEAVSTLAASNLINSLWNLMEHGVEELRLLQTVTLLITTNQVVQGELLAKSLVLCFRLHFTKNPITNNTASATIRQLVSVTFERVQNEDKKETAKPIYGVSLEELKNGGRVPSKSLRPAAADGYMLFQDLVFLVNADPPFWLTGLAEFTRTFGLELLESIFTSYPEMFFKHEEFSFLLKERVCQLVIKLFSPNIKYRSGSLSSIIPLPQQQGTLQSSEKPFFPISMRLLRIVSILIQKFYTMLITESEIFLSLLVKFLEGDKCHWQRLIALEVLHKMSTQPSLVRSKILRDIVNALGVYIQSMFINSSPSSSIISSLTNSSAPSTPTNSGSNGNSNQSLSGVVAPTPQPAFTLRGIWFPITFETGKGNCRGYYIEQLDKVEAPAAPEGHGLSTAFSCILEIVKCVSAVIEKKHEKQSCEQIESKVKDHSKDLESSRTEREEKVEVDEEDRQLCENLLRSSWCGLLASLSLLLEASTDESVTESILSSMRKLANYCGTYELSDARDALIASICRSSLPPNYSLPMLNITLPTNDAVNKPTHNRQASFDLSNNVNLLSSNASLLQQQQQLPSNVGLYLGGNDSSEFRQQVVAVGTSLASASQPQGSQQGPVMLTAKNLQCMRAILDVAHNHGAILGNSWHIILTTLQHLVWILGLKPTSGGSLKASRAGTEGGASTSSLITTAAMSDLPVLSAMLSRLFESSQNLDDAALVHLIEALRKLSQESLEMAYNNREPSLFAVAKLLETGIVNLNRIEIVWKPITTHLLEVCHHPHVKMREWGVEALTHLVKAALADQPSDITLAPLQDLSYVNHADIRQKQLDCTLQILQNSGDSLQTNGWPQLFDIIGSINDSHNENLIRCAFQCVQLIIADFLPVIPSLCLILCVDTTAKFGSQTQELNVSLTAVGLLWNVADYLFQNHEKISVSLSESNEKSGDKTELPAYDCLWMALFTRLGDLCTDARAAVRKSAGQTLFSTLATHGSMLTVKTWQSVLWQVLFPLLDRVRMLSGSASTEKITDSKSGNILLHHSRNTAQKQWAETQLLSLSGVSRIFSIKRDDLVTLEDFVKAWTLLLEFIEGASMSKNSEVSLSALKCFQELLTLPNKETTASGEIGDSKHAILWDAAWKVWCNIGLECTAPPGDLCQIDLSNRNIDLSSLQFPSQAFLTSLVQIFPSLYCHIKTKFTVNDFSKLSTVLQSSLAVPLLGSDVTTAYMLSVGPNAEQSLSPLQENALGVIETLQKDISQSDANSVLLSHIFNQLLTFASYACQPPAFGKLQIQTQNKLTGEIGVVSFVPFGERSLKTVVALYQQTANTPVVVQSHVIHSIIKTLKIPLCMKYLCPSQSTWKYAVHCLLTVVQVALPVARQNQKDFNGIWGDLATCLEGFLFPTSRVPINTTFEEQQLDESLDVKVVHMIRDHILPFAGQMPKEFVLQAVSLLNKGSIHSATSNSPVDTESSRKLREEFARSCFDTLLQFSFLGPRGNPTLFISEGQGQLPNESVGIVNKLAVTSILQRFHEVVVKYVDDEKLSGKCPLPRHRLAEISFVLKALATLASSLKKAPVESVEPEIWDLLIALYPHLVDCTTSNSIQVNRSLREVLLEYTDLLAPPSARSNRIVNGNIN